MKIYFAGSIRGGREDVPIYMEIVRMLRAYGEVLTEHVGDSTLSYKGEGLPVEEIFTRDVLWLTSSDVVVAEVTVPSIGVGYEIGKAEALGKQVLCLYRPQTDRKVSAMIAGNHHVKTICYTQVEELKEIFERELRP